MPDYAVSTVFKAKDRVSPAFKRMGKNADQFGRRTSSAFRNASKEGFRFNTIVKGIVAANVIRGAVAQVTRGLDTVISEFVKFDDTIIGAVARFDDIGPAADNFNKKVDEIGTQTRKFASESRFLAGEVATGMNELAKSGFESRNAMAAMTPMMNLAKATQTDLNEAISHSIDIMGAFGLLSGTAAERASKQAMASDVLTKATLSARLELEDLRETMKFIGPIATEVGVSFKKATTMAVFLAKAGLRGTVSATQLKAAMLRLPTKRVGDELRANGIQTMDAAGNMKDYTQILRDTSKRMDELNLGTGVRADILNRLFGLRGISGAAKLMEGVDAMDLFEAGLNNIDGLAKQVGDRIEESLLSKVLRTSSALLETGFRILEAFKGKGKKGLDSFIESINKFNVQPIVDSLRLLISSMTTFWTVTAPLRQFLPEIIGGFLAFNAVLKGMAIFQTVVMLFRMVKAMQLAIGTTAALNLIMAANPIGLIAVGIAAAVAAIIFLERKFSIFSKAWEVFKTSILAVGNAFKAFGGIFVGGNVGGGLRDIAEQSRGGASASVEREAPNAKDAAAAKATFQGRLDIAGAPEGSRFTPLSSAAPTFDVNLLGVAP